MAAPRGAAAPFCPEDSMNPAGLPLLPVCLILATAIPASAAHTIESTVHPDGISADGLTEDWGDSPVYWSE